MDDRKPSYYAVIPADVRYDPRLKPNAKLLYGEISALISADGYCYATNSFFANTFELTERGIRGIIADLEKHGYIRLMYKRDSSGKVIERRIYLNVSAPEEQPEENIFPTPGKPFPQDAVQNFRYTNPSKTVDKKKNTKKKPDPLTDEQMHPLFVDWIRSIAGDDWSRDVKNGLFNGLAIFYDPAREVKKGSPPVRSQRGFNALCKNLVSYSNGDPIQMQILLNTAIANGWTGIYPPNGGNAPKPSRPAMDEGVYKCL